MDMLWGISIGITSLFAWLTSIYTSLMLDNFTLLYAALCFPPIGVLHGMGVWLEIFERV